MKTQIKICGITSIRDALSAAELGANYLGVIVEIDYSPRCISRATARSIIESSPLPVIVLAEAPASAIRDLLTELRPHGIQLVGDCSVDEIRMLQDTTGAAVWKSVHLPKKGATAATENLKTVLQQYHRIGLDAVVLDTLVGTQKGGTGCTSDWDAARLLAACSPVPLFLAGGITPCNVRTAVSHVRPYGIDVSSGVEIRPGTKDREKIASLICNART